MTTVFFRADASLAIGTGHIMRCLTLATQLTKLGAQCHFICRQHTGNLIPYIKQRGFATHELPLALSNANQVADSIYSSWLGARQQEDALQTANVLKSIKSDWVVVDHYALDASWEKLVASHTEKLLVIDDLANRHHLCDVLLDQNLGRQSEDYALLVPKECMVFTGPQYALLRPEFAALREYSLSRRHSATLNNLMITMGGVDQHNVTGAVLDALKSCCLPANCKITVVLGSHAPWSQQISLQATTMPWVTEVKVNAQNMAELMADSDLAIGAAGSTAWERCALGLPSLFVTLAENQRGIARALHLSGAAIELSHNDLSHDLHTTVTDLLSSTAKLPRCSNIAASITDGQGATIVANHLMR